MFKNFNLQEKAQFWDAKYNFRRPTNEQFLSSEKALYRLMIDYGSFLAYAACSLGSLGCLFYIWHKVGELDIPYYAPPRIFPFILGGLLVLAFLGLDRISIFWAYRSEIKRETMGSAAWASLARLKAKNLISANNEVNVLPERIPLVPFGLHHQITIPANFFAQHGIVIGPSGSGKSTTLFMGLARSFAQVGGLVALDVKGELYEYTAHYYGDVFRFDLQSSAHTDFFDLFGPCIKDDKSFDTTYAGKIASYIIGGDNNSAGGGSKEIWDTAATQMLKCLILHLKAIEKPGDLPACPSDIFDFLAANPTDAIGDDGKPFNKLKYAMENSPIKEVSVEWGSVFSAVGDTSPKTYGSILFTMTAKLGIFRDDKVVAAMRPPTPEEAAIGRRKIDFNKLRQYSSRTRSDGEKRGTALYVVVREGEASRLATVLATFFAVAKDLLKEKADLDEKDNYVLFALDEAGNVPLAGLAEDFGVGRGRKMIFFLGFQGISQLSKQYGRDVAQVIFENTGTYIIFPGAKDHTAEWVSKMLDKTTTLLTSASDAVNNAYDNEKLTEHGRDLMMPQEIRQMKWFTQLLVIINDAPPIRARVPPNAKSIDPRRCFPRQYIFAPPKETLSGYFQRQALPVVPQNEETSAPALVSVIGPAAVSGETASAAAAPVVSASAVSASAVAVSAVPAAAAAAPAPPPASSVDANALPSSFDPAAAGRSEKSEMEPLAVASPNSEIAVVLNNLPPVNKENLPPVNDENLFNGLVNGDNAAVNSAIVVPSSAASPALPLEDNSEDDDDDSFSDSDADDRIFWDGSLNN